MHQVRVDSKLRVDTSLIEYTLERKIYLFNECIYTTSLYIGDIVR